jgi:hypothetical protein
MKLILACLCLQLICCAHETTTNTSTDAKGVVHVVKVEKSAADIPVISAVGNGLTAFAGIFIHPKP